MDLERMHAEAGDAVRFLLVYIREAHALDEWVSQDNVKQGVSLIQPTTVAGRCDAATKLCTQVGISIPAVTDTLDDAVSTVYGAWPERLYVLDEAGVVVAKTATGPFGFLPSVVRDVLVTRWGIPLSPTQYEGLQMDPPPKP